MRAVNPPLRDWRIRILLKVKREVMMRQPRVDDFVRLTQDIPELCLHRGAVGVVRSTWFAPAVAYEVEFSEGQGRQQTRTLLMPEQLSVAEHSLFGVADN